MTSHSALGGRGDAASLSQFERALYNQIDDMNYQIETLEEEVDAALNENDQVSASVAALRSMRDQLQEELDALAPLSTDAVETAKYEANEIKKTMLENELVHAEETLRIVAARIQDLVSQRMQRDADADNYAIVAARIQDLVSQRMQRDADADNYARRVMAMQKLINRPRGLGTTTSAAKELKQLEQENRNLHEQIIELRIATQRNEPSALNRTPQQKLTEAQHERDQLIVAARIQDLVSQRMQRDADADNYARRVMAMQKLINRPRGLGTTTSAAKELKQLEQENRNLHEQIIELRIATQRNDEPSALNRTPQQKLTEAQHGALGTQPHPSAEINGSAA
ncbi:Hypothetical protein, putative [Bodo saltans]|uniref:Uncharacterized protein n=1 Tax=Bodo saltans TaxID=75058 RepID=A0A0S4KKM6_BODSA|nr:Hypothetical protein, putative [Bodo saltans]|eukprot:CUM57967.1 Hypothetical protein, putative [Bodo saltans]